MRVARVIQSWMLGFVMIALRITCRVRVHNDPRSKLQADGEAYAYSILHAHQVAAAINREPNTAAMVSASGDGDLLLPGFRLLRVKAIRGSSRSNRSDKGGQSALSELISHVDAGAPVIIAVDGPRGPRNRVRKGIAVLSRKSGAAVLNVATIPSRRLILRGAWDRLQIPYPFSRIDAYFDDPLRSQPGETAEQFRCRIELSLNELEAKHDPDEAACVAARLKAKQLKKANHSDDDRPIST
jgi:lysophospholipid acyltransferase (LPLAT)-like uncharacterized protein